MGSGVHEVRYAQAMAVDAAVWLLVLLLSGVSRDCCLAPIMDHVGDSRLPCNERLRAVLTLSAGQIRHVPEQLSRHKAVLTITEFQPVYLQDCVPWKTGDSCC